MTIRAVFFDFGGVLGQWDRAYVAEFEAEYGMAEGGVLKALYGAPGWRAVEVGTLAVDDWLAEVDVALAKATRKPVPSAHSVWSRLWNDMDQDVIALARKLRANHKVGVLSNTTLMLEDQVLAPNGMLDMWDVIINSAREGVAKPDPRIYQIAAERVGFRAILHRGDFQQLTQSLKAFGVDC